MAVDLDLSALVGLQEIEDEIGIGKEADLDEDAIDVEPVPARAKG